MKAMRIAIRLIGLAWVLSACDPLEGATPYLVPAESPTPVEAISAETTTPSATSPVALNVGTAVIPPTPTFAPPLPSAFSRSIPKGAYAVLGAGTIDEAAISPDSAYLAVANAGVVVYRLDTFERVWSVPVRARQLAWSPDGRLLAGQYGDAVVVWLGHTGERVQFFEHPEGIAPGFRWSPDSQHIVTWSLESAQGMSGYLAMWRIDLGGPTFAIPDLGHVEDAEWSPDGQTIVSSRSDYKLIGDNSFLDLWNASTGSRLQEVAVKSEGYLSWSPDGSQIVASDGDPQGFPILDAHTLNTVMSLQIDTLRGSGNVAWSPNGEMVAAYGIDDVWLWDAVSGTIVHRIPVSHGLPYFLMPEPLSWSADSKLVLLSRYGGNGMVLDVSSGQLLYNFEDHDNGQVMISADGRLIVSNTGTVTVWRVENMQPVNQLQGTAAIDTLAFGHDGATLFSGSRFGITQWDVVNAVPVRSYYMPGPDDYQYKWHVYQIVLTPDNETLALSMSGPRPCFPCVKTMALATGAFASDFSATTAFAVSSWSPDGRYILWYDPDGHMIVTDRTGQDRAYTVEDVPTFGGVWSTDSKLIAYQQTMGDQPGVKILNIESGEIRTINVGNVTPIATPVSFSPNGRYLIVVNDKGDIECWNIQKSTRMFTIRDQSITNLAWSPDGKTLAMGTARADGGKILLWDVVNAKLLPPIEGHTDQVTALAFSPEGNFLASGSADGTIILWVMQPAAQP